MPTLAQAIATSYQADKDFEAAIQSAGYKSRWDWDKAKDERPMDAYCAKVIADEAMHRAFEGNVSLPIPTRAGYAK